MYKKGITVMANKNPYEIRSDLLVLAQKICYDRFKEVGGDIPQTEDIIKEATKLNNFVSDHDFSLKKG